MFQCCLFFFPAMVLGAGVNQVSCRRTVGSYFYKAPEIKRKATIDYKVYNILASCFNIILFNHINPCFY